MEGAALLLFLLPVILFIDLAFTWFTIIDQFLFDDFQDCGPAILSIIWLIMTGTFGALYTARSSKLGNRRERMKNQCGHTGMLLYFWGLGPLQELIQLIRINQPSTNLYTACLHCVVGSTLPQSFIRVYLMATYSDVIYSYFSAVICTSSVTLLLCIRLSGRYS